MPKKTVYPQKHNAVDTEEEKGPFEAQVDNLCNNICNKSILSFISLDNIADMPCLALELFFQR